ncbi:MAG: efflux RND transporter periplasmic adaptor subunit, partial [Gemmatimonadales bacterium]
VVADLCDFPGSTDPDRLRGLLSRADLWLLVEKDAPYAQFVHVLAGADARVVACTPAERSEGFVGLVGALAGWLQGPPSDDLAKLVLSKEPLLGPLADLVGVVCAHPWEIRRPSGLADATDLRLTAVKQRLAGLDFTRTEHFLVAVRTIAFEQLVHSRRVPIQVARRLAGIGDPSNHRKELARAMDHSSKAMRRLASFATALLLGVLLAWSSACTKKAPAAAAHGDSTQSQVAGAGDTSIALPVVGDVVRRGDLVLTLRTTGQVRAERLVHLEAEAGGTVAAVLVRPGDRVRRGQVLAQFDPRPFDLAVREAQGAYDDAQVRLMDVLIGDDLADTSPVAVERRRNARLRAGVAGAEARLERARLDSARATIRAPFGGTVDQILVVVGQVLSPGDPVTTVVDLGSLVVDAAVLEHDLPLIRRGATAVVSLAAVGGRSYPGTAVAVLPLVDTTARAGRVVVRVRTTDGVLRPGMYADVELEASRLPDRVLVPAAAVIERDGRPLVFRYQGGRAEWVYVMPGRSNGRETEILSDSVTGRPAVAAGDTILVEGHLTLTHDAPVRLLRPEVTPRRS